MGLFNKLKDNLTGGGVKVTLDAPDHLTLNTVDIPVSITVTNGGTQCYVKQVILQLVEVAEERSLGYSDDDSGSTEERTVMEIKSDESFNLSPNETKVLVLSLTPEKEPDVNPNSVAARAKGVFAKVSGALDSSDHSYYLKARVDVVGIALDPSCRKDVTVSR